jgi:hypothetical protein
MKWIKETFAVRFNLLDGRTGHIWGDRYSSEIIVGEPPEWAEVYVFMAAALPVKRGNWRREAAARGFRWQAGNVDAAGRNPDAEAGSGSAGFQAESGNRERRQTGTGRGGQTPVTA